MNLTMAKRRRQRATRNERKAQAWKTRWLSPTFGCNAGYFSFLVIGVNSDLYIANIISEYCQYFR